jgi:integrase
LLVNKGFYWSYGRIFNEIFNDFSSRSLSGTRTDWLLKSVIPRLQWPKPVYKDKRAITAEEHAAILGAEVNAERKAFYQLCWHLGGSQGDQASLQGEDVDWENSTVSFTRKKTKVPVIVRLGTEALNLLKDRPAEGPLFPYLATVRAGDRATEFASRCRWSWRTDQPPRRASA